MPLPMVRIRKYVFEAHNIIKGLPDPQFRIVMINKSENFEVHLEVRMFLR